MNDVAVGHCLSATDVKGIVHATLQIVMVEHHNAGL